MEVTIKELALHSWMSQASYLDFQGSDSLQAQLTFSPINQDKTFSDEQSNIFTDPTDSYSLINHHPNDATGFSATVFKSNAGESYTIAVRGTEPWGPLNTLTDLVWADLGGVVLSGKAIPQLISSFKYYKQITTPEGQPVHYSDVELEMMGRLYARNSLGLVGELLPDQIKPKGSDSIENAS